MGSESLDFLTEQELKWISQSEQAPNNENVNTNKRFKSSAKRSRPVAEITLAATSLCKRGLDITDKFYVMSMDTNIRLGSVRLKHEVIRIGKEDSFFLTTLAELDICEFEFKLIYVPPKLFIGQELYLECTIRIIQQAFRDNNEDGILGENSISSKKAALDLLFKRAGLLKPKDAKPINEQCADLVGNFGTMFCTRKKFRYLEVAAGMDCNLRDYQKEALAFMFDRETAANDNEISPLYHKIPYLDGDYFYYSSFLGEIRMNLPMGNVCQGGILADEMGLGKTVEILALVHSNRSKRNWGRMEFDGNNSSVKYYSPATLVVGPLNLLMQWKQEIERFFKRSQLNAIIYHGSERKPTEILDAKRSDVILTTYGTITSEYTGGDSMFHKIHWHRIILDEAHMIKEKSTGVAKSCCALLSDYRWCVTGTPVINKIDDLYSLLRFLRISPWCHLKVLKTFVSDPFESKNNSVLETLRIIFETLMLRRTKDMNDSQGQKIVEIPPKYVEIKYLNFSDREKEIYDLWYSNSKAQVQDLEASGKIDYIHVFSIILRLRQVCIHHRLPSTTPTAEIKILSDKDFDSDILERLQDTRECPICFENMEQVSVLKCNHFICVSCVEDIVDRRVQVGEETIECPICREVCNHEDVARVERCSEKGILKPSVVESSKFKALMAELLRLRVECPDEKVIVFSQFSKALDMLETEFNNEGIGFSRYDGSMNVKQRERQLESFRNTNPVLLASLRSTGVGLNLVEASRVFLLDPWWNSAVENQAIDRVHRLGQKRPVFVTRYIIKDSIEENMLQIQNRKHLVAGAVNGASTANLEDLLSIFK